MRKFMKVLFLNLFLVLNLVGCTNNPSSIQNQTKETVITADVGHGNKGANVSVKIDFANGKTVFNTKASTPGLAAGIFASIQSYQVYLIKNAASTYPLNGDPLGAGDLVAGPVTVNRSGGTSHTITFINVPGSTAAFGSGNYYYAAVRAYSGSNATGSELIKANNGNATAWGATTQGISNKLSVSTGTGVQVRNSDLVLSFYTALPVDCKLNDASGATLETFINPVSGSGTITSGYINKTLKITPFQSIPTNGSIDTEYFTIGTDSYLAVANEYNGTSYNLNSKIYKWDGTSFTFFQDIPTIGNINFQYFTIGNDSYLAVANYHDGTSYNLNSKIYKWDGTSFVPFQDIPTNGAFDFEYFTIGPDSYLAVANHHYNNTSYNINSKIYKWDGTSFVFFQDIPTMGATDFKYFTIGTESYLAVANEYNGSAFNINSKIYKWNGTSFVFFQDIPTVGVRDIQYFILGTESYLAVANAYDGSTYNLNSKIYKWNGSSFIDFQSIVTNGASDLDSFKIGSETYLCVANTSNGITRNIDSKIYKWNGTSFIDFRVISTSGAYGFEHFTINGLNYLVLSNYYNDTTFNNNSVIYKLE